MLKIHINKKNNYMKINLRNLIIILGKILLLLKVYNYEFYKKIYIIH
jgi:hypothetical protein